MMGEAIDKVDCFDLGATQNIKFFLCETHMLSINQCPFVCVYMKHTNLYV